METVIASKTIDGEEIHFILINDVYSDDDEPFTLFVNTNQYNAQRQTRDSKFFYSSADAFEYCKNQYGVPLEAWREEPRFKQQFEFEFCVSNLGVPTPYVTGFEGSEVIFRLSEREIITGEVETTERVLNISGNRAGLERLAAMILLCSTGEEYHEGMHIHLEGKEGFFLPGLAATIRDPTYFEALLEDRFREATTGWFKIKDED